MSNSKSPLFNHLNGSINGAVSFVLRLRSNTLCVLGLINFLSSIRAYGIQDWVTKRTCEKVDTVRSSQSLGHNQLVS